MLPTHALAQLGGAATWRRLSTMTTRKRLRTAVARGEVLRLGQGRFGLPAASQAITDATRLSGVASHLSAALGHGWQVVQAPAAPEVIVKRNRKLTPDQRRGVDVRYRDLEPHEVHGWLTSPHRTVLDCSRDLPFAEALAVADSALRVGDVDQGEMLKRARALPSNGRRAAIRVAEEATPLAANPFESVLRAIALDVPDLRVRPQVVIDERGLLCRPDLVDPERRLVLEADSWAFHGHRKALHRDCERYNALVVRGWTVLRFSWEHVMLQPDYVRELLVAMTEGPSRRASLPPLIRQIG